MKTKWYRAVLLALAVTAVADIPGASAAEAAEKSEGAKRLTTGVEDQAAVALTIYNVNLGLVKDQRHLYAAVHGGGLPDHPRQRAGPVAHRPVEPARSRAELRVRSAQPPEAS